MQDETVFCPAACTGNAIRLAVFFGIVCVVLSPVDGSQARHFVEETT